MRTLTGKFINCSVCDKKFYIPLNRFNTARFCSSKCKGDSARKKFNKECEVCDVKFDFIACRKDKAKYCSRKCYYKAMHLLGSIVKKCKECEKEFRCSPSHKRTFCSRKCVWENKKKYINGNCNTLRGNLWRRGLINVCCKCGYSKNKKILGIHHRDHNNKNNSIDNIMILCPNCHSDIHNKHIVH